MTSYLSNNDEKLLAASAARSVRGKFEKGDFAFIMREDITSSNRAREMRQKLCTKSPQNISANMMLAMLIETGMSYKDYNKWKKVFKDHHANICPKQSDMSAAKRECYQDNVIITEASAESSETVIKSHCTKNTDSKHTTRL